MTAQRGVQKLKTPEKRRGEGWSKPERKKTERKKSEPGKRAPKKSSGW